MFIGFSGAAFNQDAKTELVKGQSVTLGHYALKLTDTSEGVLPNYRWWKINLDVTKDGEYLGQLIPERRYYAASKQQTSEVAIRRRVNADVYVNFAGPSDTDENKMVIEAYINPLVSWLWCGYWVVLIGTLICLVPSKTKLVYPRTEVVEIVGKHEQVEN